MNIALVASSGGITCAYSAGAILALKQHFGFSTPTWAIGCSGSAGTLAYYTAGQYRSGQVIWEELLPTHNFIYRQGFRHHLDIDYLIDKIFKKQERLDTAAVARSSTELFIAATNQATGEPRYFSNRESVDLFEVIRASCAAPYFYGKAITIEETPYINGAFTAPFYTNIARAQSLGADRVIAVDNINSGRFNWELVVYSFLMGKQLARNVWRICRNEVRLARRLRQDNKVILIRPSRRLPAGFLDINPARIKRTFDLGYHDVVTHPAIAKLF